MKIKINKEEQFNSCMSYCSLALFYTLAFIVFDWPTMREYILSFFIIMDNWMYHSGLGKTVFQLSDYLRKKKYHSNESSKKLFFYSAIIFFYTIFLVFVNDYGITYNYTNNKDIFWKCIYIRSISSLFISVIYIIRNYGQIIKENTIQNQELKESLQKESEKATKAQMNMLKLQLDPHFMFNSLNTLMGLIEESPKKAEDFTLELSRIYKYIVANLDQDTISLKAGMAFINNYCQLIEIRYPQQFCVEIEQGIVQDAHEKILPLSLQLLVENAIKHNQHSTKNPLRIQIKREDDYVCVTNTLNPYPDNEKAHVLSMGIGMKNLNDRYKLISDRIPIALQSKDEYTVKIPII